MVEIDTKTAKKPYPLARTYQWEYPPPPASELQRDRLLLQHHVTPAGGTPCNGPSR